MAANLMPDQPTDPGQDPDTLLMLRVKRGDRDSFTELVERWKHPVIGFIYRTLPDPDEAEDLAQATFVQLWKTAARYQPTARFSTFLFTIARNLCLNEIRRRVRHPADSLDEPRPKTKTTPCDKSKTAGNPGPMPRRPAVNCSDWWMRPWPHCPRNNAPR